MGIHFPRLSVLCIVMKLLWRLFSRHSTLFRGRLCIIAVLGVGVAKTLVRGLVIHIVCRDGVSGRGAVWVVGGTIFGTSLVSWVGGASLA